MVLSKFKYIENGQDNGDKRSLSIIKLLAKPGIIWIRNPDIKRLIISNNKVFINLFKLLYEK